jgi:hypothetical protein
MTFIRRAIKQLLKLLLYCYTDSTYKLFLFIYWIKKIHSFGLHKLF